MQTPHHPNPRTASHDCGSLVTRLLLPLVLLLALGSAAPSVYAEDCNGCSGPSVEYLQQHAGLQLESRGDWLGGYARDYLLTDAGECTATLTEPPTVTREMAWLVLRGEGEVWNCPHSKSQDTITVEAGATDSTEWTLKVSSSVKLEGLVASAKVEVESGRTQGEAIHEVTRISKTITPSYCHRLKWQGYFQVASFKAEAEFKFTQRWAWWTKNRKTGAKVHQSGDVQMDCGTGTVELGRTAPISGYFALQQSGCDAAECGWVIPKHLGFYPLLPPYLPDPRGEDPAETPQSATEEEDEPPPAEPEEPLPSSDELGEPPTGPLPDPLAEGDDTR